MVWRIQIVPWSLPGTDKLLGDVGAKDEQIATHHAQLEALKNDILQKERASEAIVDSLSTTIKQLEKELQVTKATLQRGAAAMKESENQIDYLKSQLCDRNAACQEKDVLIAERTAMCDNRIRDLEFQLETIATKLEDTQNDNKKIAVRTQFASQEQTDLCRPSLCAQKLPRNWSRRI